MIEWDSLWHHQQDGINELRDGYKFVHGPPATRQLFIAPTGAGKTRTAAFIGAGAVARKTPTIFLVDRVALVNQASQAFDDAGVDHGIIRAGHWRRRPDEYLQVCSAQTIEKRGYWPDCELLIVDEAHAIRKGTLDFINARPEMRVLGLTATPFTKGLGQIYQRAVSTTTTNQLIEDGVLVPAIAYAGVTPDMSGAALSGGEFTASDAAKRGMSIVGDIVGEWIQKTREHCGGPAKTIVFSADVAHGEEICRQFQAAGFNFQQISYKDHNDERREALIKDFSLPFGVGQVQGLVSCEALAKGFDVKDVVVGIFARPYRKSLSAHIQQLGRVMRSAPGKEFCLILDHCGNYIRFYQDTMRVFEEGAQLLDDKPLDSFVRPEPTEREKLQVRCGGCGAIMPPKATVCPACGKEKVRISAAIKGEGKMVKIGGKKVAAVGEYAWAADPSSVWRQLVSFGLLRYGGDMEKTRRMAQRNYITLFGEPARRQVHTTEPQNPSPQLEAFARRELQNYARRASFARRG